MENGKEGAFPMIEKDGVMQECLTKREFMATQMLAGLMPSCRHEEEHLHYAVQAVAYADALLEALSKS